MSVPSEHNKGRVHFDESLKPPQVSKESYQFWSTLPSKYLPRVLLQMEFEIPQIFTPTNLRQIPVEIVHAEVPDRKMISVPKRVHQIFEANEGGITSSSEEELSRKEIKTKRMSDPFSIPTEPKDLYQAKVPIEIQRPGLFSFPFSRNSYTKENQKQRIRIEQSNEEEDGSEDGYSSPIQLKSVSNPIYQMKSSKGKEQATEPKDPQHQASNYQDEIVAASS
ncbi:hypothetical protein O181_045316 [Austropuccinia psidii MF-1]|uniref:Uncharacterized protein n=1 Tax=Austropuccinia psidii MF-1 TaxID=1389203 RepID=A0A9Q3HHN6_9BASI|nr:hypothetical protein [Austropuccinia psidii MF-1]